MWMTRVCGGAVVDRESDLDLENEVDTGNDPGPRTRGPGAEAAGERLSAAAHTTMLTIFGARMISLRTVWPSSSSCTRGSAITAASRSASEISGSTSMR